MLHDRSRLAASFSFPSIKYLAALIRNWAGVGNPFSGDWAIKPLLELGLRHGQSLPYYSDILTHT